MKKKLLILSAVIAASTTLVYADDYTDGKANYTYSASDVTTLQAGTVVENNDITFTKAVEDYAITVACDFTTIITNRERTINTTLVALNGSVSNYVPKSERKALVDNKVDTSVKIDNETVKVFDDDETKKIYTISNNELYQKYALACQHAAKEDSRIVKGDKIPETITKDIDGYAFNEKAYYMLSGGKSASTAKSATPILAVNHKCTSGTIYTNCFDTYVPTYISSTLMSDDNLSISNEGKLCTVTGYVDQARIDNIISTNAKSKNCLNFDFTSAVVLGEITLNLTGNKIAYFPNGSTATGKNIVIGTTCDNYAISDNGQEIYVSKDFSASTATYTRTFSSDGWGTIVLPFNIGATTGVFSKQAYFSDYTTDNAGKILLTFTNEASLVANKPYLVKVAENPAAQLTELNTTVRTTSPQTFNVNGIKFIGTYTGVASTVMTDNNYHILNGKGQLLKTSAALKPGRCYIDFGQSSSAKLANTTIQIIDEDGSIEEIETGSEATSIDDIENGEVVATQYISVNGQISNEPFNGMNIVKKTFANGTVETSKVVY